MSSTNCLFSLDQTVAPAATALPVSLEQVKLQLGLPLTQALSAAEESELVRLCKTATLLIERLTRRQILTATYVLRRTRFPLGNGPIWLPRPPVATVSSVTYHDPDGVQQTFSDWEQLSGKEPGGLVPTYNNFWPSYRLQNFGIEVTYSAGYGADHTASIPFALQQAILLQTAYLYDQRSGVSERPLREIPLGVRDLTDSYRAPDDLLLFA